jgi:t-SNARE complex subunit (syntaxin)
VGDQLIQSAKVTRVSLDVIEQTVRDIEADTGHGPADLVRQINELRHALGTMASVTNRNLRTAEDATRATSELRLNSDNLQQVVAAYKLRPRHGADPGLRPAHHRHRNRRRGERTPGHRQVKPVATFSTFPTC